MARIRTIKPEFPQSETIGALSRDARLLFIQIWTIADDAGRARATSRVLASLLYPFDDDAPRLIGKWLAELEDKGCIRRYEVDGTQYLDIPKWLKHQKIDRPSRSHFPEYVARAREGSRGLDAGPSTLDLGPKKENTSYSCAVAPATRTNGSKFFDEFWQAYPRREGSNPKEAARKLFTAALKAGAETGDIIAGAREYASRDRDKIGTPYIAQATTWLRQQRWKDYAAPELSEEDRRILEFHRPQGRQVNG